MLQNIQDIFFPPAGWGGEGGGLHCEDKVIFACLSPLSPSSQKPILPSSIENPSALTPLSGIAGTVCIHKHRVENYLGFKI